MSARFLDVHRNAITNLGDVQRMKRNEQSQLLASRNSSNLLRGLSI